MATNLASKTAPAKKKDAKSKPPTVTEKSFPKHNNRASSSAVASTPTSPFHRRTSKGAAGKASNKATTGPVVPKVGSGTRAASSLEGRGIFRRRQPLQPKTIAVRSARRTTNRGTLMRRKAVATDLESKSFASGDSLCHSGASSNEPGGWVKQGTDETSFRDSVERGETAPSGGGRSSILSSKSDVSIGKFDGSDTDDDDSVVRICVRDASCTEWIDSIDSVAVAGRGGRQPNRFS